MDPAQQHHIISNPHYSEQQMENQDQQIQPEQTVSKQVEQLLEVICSANEERDRLFKVIDEAAKQLGKLITVERQSDGAFVHGDYIISLDPQYNYIPSLRYKVRRREQLPVGLTLEAPAVKAIANVETRPV